ncbi:MAG: hypothetical protein ABSC48_00305 [Terracidiphilus sp.]|jgi:hypothetical protein
MSSPDYNSAANEESCLKEKLPPSHFVFPWKTRPAGSVEGPPLRERAKLKLIDKINLAIDPGQSIQANEPKTLTPDELDQLYAGTSVPRHRYLAPSLAEALTSPEIAPHPARWLAGISGMDLFKLVDAWLKTNHSTEYEQLYGIGLDPETGQLTGSLKVKQGNGYSGGPGTAGSREYVAFWVDWGSGFEYEGTASAAVHDFRQLPPAGLEYRVSLPCDLLTRAQRCKEAAETIKVRAVLSWNTPPSTTDPNAPVVWGNILESRISILPSPADRAGNPVRCQGAASAREIVQAGVAEMAGRGYSFALHLRERANMNHDAPPNLSHASAELLLRSDESDESSGFPQK